jgi:polyhydroxybutyrate depolymerase
MRSFSCAGIGYTVTIPPACPSGGCGLILDVHGATMNAAMEEANTQLRVAAPKLGFVVIQPTAPGKVPSTSWTPFTDDVKVHAVLVEAIDVLGIDKRRVHMAGFSQGGMMTSRFLCRHADLFASVAPAAGTGCSFIGVDAPSREVPMLYMHGTTDLLVAFAQGTAQRDAAIAAWKMTGGTTVASDGKYSWKRWTSPKGTVLEFIQHDYKASSLSLQGHCYPGSTDKGAEPGQLFPFACLPSNAFVWGDEVLKFFVAHPR